MPGCRVCSDNLEESHESSSPGSEGDDLALRWAEARQCNINGVKNSLDKAEATQKHSNYWCILLNWSAFFAVNKLVHSLSYI